MSANDNVNDTDMLGEKACSPSPVPPVPPPLPAPDYPGSVLSASNKMYNWTEVTAEFRDAVQELTLGELLHDDLFGLFEAMSAIEMMDPKMDAGMRCNRQERRPRNFKAAVEEGHLKLRDLSAAEQIGVMDATLACLVTWLEGHSLAQTVFTNLYLHNVHEVEDAAMKAFSVAVLKVVALVKDFVNRGGVFEEEDFQPTTYGFKLCAEVSEQRCLGMLREAEEELKDKEGSNSNSKAAKNAKGKVAASEETKAVSSRLRFLRLFFGGLCALYRHELTEGNRLLTAAKAQAETILETIPLGIATPEGDEKANLMGFDRLVNQRLLPPTFPRYTATRSRESAVAHFRALADRLVAATSVSLRANNFHNAVEFFVDYSANSPCVLSRSVLQVLYQPLHNINVSGTCATSSSSSPTPPALSLPPTTTPHPRSSPQFPDLLRDACKAFIAPPALVHKTAAFSAEQVKECISNFFTQCCRPMGLLLQTFGHNRARQRDKIASLLEEFAAIQEDADKLDTMLNAVSTHNAESSSDAAAAAAARPHMLFFSTWLLYHVLRLMVRYLQSGFELELYSVHEYPYVYWYLYELLYPWLTTCLHRADTYLVESEQTLEAQKQAGKNKKKAKSQSKKKPPASASSSKRPYAREITLCQAYTHLCAGYFKVTVGLKREGRMLIPCSQFDEESVRYDHRFAPFQTLLTPPLMPYGQYEEIYNHTVEASRPRDLYLYAATDFGRARQILESVSNFGATAADVSIGSDNFSAELASLVAVAKNNLVVASILAKDPTRRVDFEFAVHPTFPSIKLA